MLLKVRFRHRCRMLDPAMSITPWRTCSAAVS